VWADYGKYPSWPAKVMLEENDIVTVQFFGDHSTASVMRNKVVPYSRKDLSKNNRHRKALKECFVVSKFSISAQISKQMVFLFLIKTGAEPVP